MRWLALQMLKTNGVLRVIPGVLQVVRVRHNGRLPCVMARGDRPLSAA